MATAVSVSLALAGVVATEAPAQALMTAPSGGSGYTTSTISEPQLAYVSMGSSTPVSYTHLTLPTTSRV